MKVMVAEPKVHRGSRKKNVALKCERMDSH